MPFTLKDLGENIRRLRKSLPSRLKPGKMMLQYELADAAGIPAPSLCNIERGKYKNPTWELLSKIADGLQCDISDFFMTDKKQVSPSQIALNEMIDMIIRERLDTLIAEKGKKESF